jgi:hypothetical protein
MDDHSLRTIFVDELIWTRERLYVGPVFPSMPPRPVIGEQPAGAEPSLTVGHWVREAERGRDTDEHWQSLVGTAGMEDILSVMPV